MDEGGDDGHRPHVPPEDVPPKWAILGWFVPIMNWFRPKQVINDVWRATDPDAPERQGNVWLDKPVPGYLLAWWLVLLLSDRVAQAAMRSSLTNAFGDPTGDPVELLKFENVL